MATGTFTHSSSRTRTLKMLVKTQRKVLKPSNLAYRMLLPQGQIYAKNVAFCVRIDCVRLGRYCGKRESHDLFPYAGLAIVSPGVLGGLHFHGETKEMFCYRYTSLSEELASTNSSHKTTTSYKENRRGLTLHRLDEIRMLLLLGL